MLLYPNFDPFAFNLILKGLKFEIKRSEIDFG
jgi:hypothetical protein